MAAFRVDVQELTARLVELVNRAEAGDEIIVTQNDQPHARLLPLPQAQSSVPRVLGLHPHGLRIEADFDAPLPDDFWLGK